MTYVETLKSSEDIALHDLIDIGGPLYEVLEKTENSDSITFRLFLVAVRSEQMRGMTTYDTQLTLPKGVVMMTKK